MPRFYVLARPESGSEYDTDFTPVTDARYGDAPRCPACGRFTGMREWLGPFRVELEVRGRRFGDVMARGANLLVSQRFHDVYRSEGLRGLEGFAAIKIVAVRARGRKILEPPAYVHATVKRDSAAIDPSATDRGTTESPACPLCLEVAIERIRGVVIDEATWNGDDVFVARGLPGTVIASERFREICQNHNITHVRLVESTEYVNTFGL